MPIQTFELRDRTGRYANAKAGSECASEFSDVSGSCKVPEKRAITIDFASLGVDESVQQVLLKLEHEGYMR
jgi:sulfate adenylyltransferase